ncbi:hypothetical protein [Janibacter terrae]|uniref:hypothetical protein n=1 Tax=Janibacter terrae TaxID=103817 RepID=UPI0008340345|nr:hypothetical protein [Janibacter terrae]
MSDTTTSITADITHGAHAWNYCHDDMHVDGDSCPTCRGWLTRCPDEQCHDAAHDAEWIPDHIKAKRHAKALRDRRQTPPAPEATPGQVTGPTSPRAGIRPGVNPTDRVTLNAPFAVERTVTDDDDFLVTIRLTDEAARQLARDLTRRHMADLILLARLQTAVRHPHASTETVAEHHRVMNRLSGSLTAHATTVWELTVPQAEGVLEELQEAAAEPEICLVGTCTAYAVDGYCAGHADGI